MKTSVANYISSYLVKNNICTCFMVAGGGAMYLNDAIGHEKGMKCIFNHHEQACSIAAEGYTKTVGEPALVCVTSGPGAINALNGVIGAYQDSIPMLVLSGQVKTSLLAKNYNLTLRTLGNQEFDIISCLSNACKYSETITDPMKIKYCLDKALYVMKYGRPGPCWLDIPLDIQNATIETEKLIEFERTTFVDNESIEDSEKEINSKINILIKRLINSKRPIIYAGAGIRIANARKELLKLSRTLHVPVVTCWDSIDLVNSNDNLYCGRAGTMGDRAGNFAIQNSDFLLCIGTRLNIYQVGYDKTKWATNAFVVMNDICNNELKKETIHVDLPICKDCKAFMNKLIERITKKNLKSNFNEWNKTCLKWKSDYKVIDENKDVTKRTNIYKFFDALSRALPRNSITVVANGSASVVGSQTYYINKQNRFIMNCGLSSMGYDLPAAIGACIGNNRKEIYCIAGDGSIQMNLQELQTIVTNNLPIKIFVINNNGYQQIRLSQKNIFKERKLIGTGIDSGDLSFPSFKKIAKAYGYKYFSITNNAKIEKTIEEIIKYDGYCICEVICGSDYIFKPKSATKKLEDGSLFSPPLEDMAPFLSKDELSKNMMR